MFRGNSYHNLDAKGRLIIPTRFRDVLKQSSVESLMVSRMDGAVVCYSFEQWRKIEERFQGVDVTSLAMRRFRRIFIGGAFDCPLDKQGRILIPPALRQECQLDKEVVLVGVLDHFEIWSLSNWKNEEEKFQVELNTDEMRSEIAGLAL